MNRLTKNIAICLILFGLCGCQRACERIDRKYQSGNRTYVIKMYSGGQCVFYDSLRTMVNDSEHSDGCYYYKGDTLVEVSGDYVVKSVK